jgi:hypothetical protein
MTNDHDANMAAIGLPTRNPFDWRLELAAPVEETPVQRNKRMSRERARNLKRLKSGAMRENKESGLGYSHPEAADRNLSIRGRG